MAGRRLSLDANTVRELLVRGGWPCDRIAEDTWRSHFRGKRASFPFYVKTDEAGYVNFAIVPFLKSPEDQAAQHRLHQRLLELNHTLLMAKFSIDDDLDVLLSVEYPTADLDESEFTDALDVLGYYADQHYDELKALRGPEPRK